MITLYRFGSVIGLVAVISSVSFIFGINYQKKIDNVAKLKSYNSQLVADLKRLNQINEINAKVSQDYAMQIESQRESYLQFTQSLQDKNNKLVAELNKTNKINGILINNIRQSFQQDYKYNPTIESTNYLPSSLIQAVANVGYQCNKIRTQLINLIKWNKEIAK
jgi:hypothetical protein